MATEAEFAAMSRAIELAGSVDAQFGANPRVGAVLLTPDGRTISEGAHHGAGTPHAEVVAIAHAGAATHGATAVVTLEPCSHTGRTGPCTQAIIDAGITRVVFAQSDPNPEAAGGAAVLRSAGIDVEGGVAAVQASELNRQWSIAVSRGRPYVTLKIAATLDGRIAAHDGTSRWITGPQAREQVHELRAACDAVIVGTGTALADDPSLTDRRDGARRQPAAVVIGMRSLPSDSRLAMNGAIALATHDLDEAMSQLYATGFRRVLVEGGATLAAAMIKAHLVDELIWYVAPTLLGGGRVAVDELGITTIDEASRWQRNGVTLVGDDVRIDLTPVSDRE